MRGGGWEGTLGFEVVVDLYGGLGDHVVEIRVELHGYDVGDVVVKN